MDSCHYWEDQHTSHGVESINVSFFTHLNAMINMYVNIPGYFGFDFFHMSLVMRKTDFCICENKAADQLRGFSLLG